MINELTLQSIPFGNKIIELYVPDPNYMKARYEEETDADSKTPFPYWSQIWSSAIALAQFIEEQPHYIQDKKVLELAAGLGLPSLVAAKVAKEVFCTDYLPETIAVLEKSVAYNKIENISCKLLDWNEINPSFSTTDVVLMSDVNYNPTDFETLFQVFKNFLSAGATIILSTPQRLVAKSFVEQLMPWCKLKEEIDVHQQNSMIPITILVLKLATAE